MHSFVLVIGDDPVGKARQSRFMADWAAIGGRFTGMLPVNPGAPSARVYGDALPPFEAEIARMLVDRGWALGRPGRSRRNGVDQARKRDVPASGLAFLADIAGFIVADDRTCHSDDDFGARLALLESVSPDALMTVVDVHS
jgi:hypothetical protein